jgi:hypothetical protein
MGIPVGGRIHKPPFPVFNIRILIWRSWPKLHTRLDFGGVDNSVLFYDSSDRGERLAFSDCTARLKQQVDVADGVVACFNALARARNFGEITPQAIRKSIQAEAEQQVLRWVSIAQLEMLATFGEPRAFRAVLDQVVAPERKPARG